MTVKKLGKLGLRFLCDRRQVHKNMCDPEQRLHDHDHIYQRLLLNELHYFLT